MCLALRVYPVSSLPGIVMIDYLGLDLRYKANDLSLISALLMKVESPSTELVAKPSPRIPSALDEATPKV